MITHPSQEYIPSLHEKTQFGGGASGGMDDRFDLLLVSNSLPQPGGMDVLVNSHTTFGNDGNHFDLAINNGANGAVADSVANALHAAATIYRFSPILWLVWLILCPLQSCLQLLR